MTKNRKDSYLGSIDELISKTLSDGLDVTECSLSCPSCQKPDGLCGKGHEMVSYYLLKSWYNILKSVQYATKSMDSEIIIHSRRMIHII